MRENRLSGLMRGGKQTVIGTWASQSVASRLLYRSDAWRSRRLRYTRPGKSVRHHGVLNFKIDRPIVIQLLLKDPMRGDFALERSLLI